MFKIGDEVKIINRKKQKLLVKWCEERKKKIPAFVGLDFPMNLYRKEIPDGKIVSSLGDGFYNVWKTYGESPRTYNQGAIFHESELEHKDKRFRNSKRKTEFSDWLIQ